MIKGRPPVARLAVLGAIRVRPSEGLDYKQITAITGLSSPSVKDALCKLRKAGEVHWLKRGRHVLHFASQAAMLEYEREHPALDDAQKQDSPQKEYERKNARIPRILEVLREGPPVGLSAQEVSDRTGITGGNTRRLLKELLASGEVFRHGPQHWMRWFHSAEAAKVGAPLVDASIALHVESVRAKKAYAGRKTASKRQRKMERCASYNFARRAHGPKEPAAPVQIIMPEHVQIQRAPTPRDTRFAADPGYVGEFTREWKQLRSQR
jgi:hypothetical protein